PETRKFPPVLQRTLRSTGPRKDAELLQLPVLYLGFLQDGDVGVGVFPEREEILVRALRFGGVACHRVGTSELKTRQCSGHKVHDDTAMIEQLLELGGCGGSIMCQQVGLTAQIGGVEGSQL